MKERKTKKYRIFRAGSRWMSGRWMKKKNKKKRAQFIISTMENKQNLKLETKKTIKKKKLKKLSSFIVHRLTLVLQQCTFIDRSTFEVIYFLCTRWWATIQNLAMKWWIRNNHWRTESFIDLKKKEEAITIDKKLRLHKCKWIFEKPRIEWTKKDQKLFTYLYRVSDKNLKHKSYPMVEQILNALHSLST